MCHQLWIHFNCCPHILLRQGYCREDPALRSTVIFCQDYRYEQKTLRDACPKQECQERKQQMLLNWTWAMHESINEAASQKQRIREALGIPDMIQLRVAEIDAEQLARIRIEEERLAALARQQEENEFRERMAASQVQTYEYHPVETSMPQRYTATTLAATPDPTYDSLPCTGYHAPRPQHREPHVQSAQWQEGIDDDDSASGNLYLPITATNHRQLPAIRFGAHGGIVKAPTSQLGPRAPMLARFGLDVSPSPAMRYPQIDSAIEMSPGISSQLPGTNTRNGLFPDVGLDVQSLKTDV